MEKVKKKTVKEEGYEDLYICMYNATEKRKNLLKGMKNSLIMQEEFERVKELRNNKSMILNEIKKSLTKVNQEYQELKNNLPNVKNVLSYTEKELTELENQINMLKQDSKETQEEIRLSEEVKNSMKKFKDENITLKKPKEKLDEKVEVKVETKIKKEKEKELTKLDRIKNNLKVIESKLKHI